MIPELFIHGVQSLPSDPGAAGVTSSANTVDHAQRALLGTDADFASYAAVVGAETGTCSCSIVSASMIRLKLSRGSTLNGCSI